MIALAPAPDEAPANFVVELTQFNGPLDLLLALLRDEQIDISDIPIARVAEQFLARIHSLGLDEAADYLEMAARLLRIKAQMLLPRRDGDETWEDPRAELVRRLLEYQQMREVVDILERHANARRDRFAHPFSAFDAPVRAPSPAPLALNLVELFAAVDRVLRASASAAVHAVIPRALDVPGALERVRAVFADRTRTTWSALLPRDAEPWEILSLLLAVLEMARLGECTVCQQSAFAPLELVRSSTFKVNESTSAAA